MGVCALHVVDNLCVLSSGGGAGSAAVSVELAEIAGLTDKMAMKGLFCWEWMIICWRVANFLLSCDRVSDFFVTFVFEIDGVEGVSKKPGNG